LRRTPDDGAGKQTGVLSDTGIPADHNVRVQNGPVAELSAFMRQNINGPIVTLEPNWAVFATNAVG
jgi:hypothetical protein